MDDTRTPHLAPTNGATPSSPQSQALATEARRIPATVWDARRLRTLDECVHLDPPPPGRGRRRTPLRHPARVSRLPARPPQRQPIPLVEDSLALKRRTRQRNARRIVPEGVQEAPHQSAFSLHSGTRPYLCGPVPGESTTANMPRKKCPAGATDRRHGRSDSDGGTKRPHVGSPSCRMKRRRYQTGACRVVKRPRPTQRFGVTRHPDRGSSS